MFWDFQPLLVTRVYKAKYSTFVLVPLCSNLHIYCLFPSPLLVTRNFVCLGLFFAFLLGDWSRNGHSQASQDNRACPVMQVLCNIFKIPTAKNPHSQVLLNFTSFLCEEQKERSKIWSFLEPPEVFIGWYETFTAKSEMGFLFNWSATHKVLAEGGWLVLLGAL